MERMEEQMTAVEFFADYVQEQLNVFLPGAVLDDIMLNKAKAMEKEQIKSAYNDGKQDYVYRNYRL